MADTREFVTGHGALIRLTRGIVWAFFGAAVLAGIATVASWIARTVGHPIALDLVANAALPASADAGPATMVSGTYSAASVELAGLSPLATTFAVAASVAGVLAQAAVPAAIALIAWRLLRRRSVFRPQLSVTVTVLGAILLVFGMIAQGFGGLASGIAAHELNGSSQFWPIAGRFDPTVLGVGVLLMLVGLAFGYGERLQKDTEGLV